MTQPGFTPVDRGSLNLPRIGIGVLGYGFMGRVHTNAYLKIPYSFAQPAALPELVALCGRSEARVADAARLYCYRGYYTDWRQMVRDPAIQVLDNCTPDDQHRVPSIAAAEAGKHVICEKPLAMTLEDARAMAEAVRQAGVKSLCCFNYRFLPAVRLAKDLIDRGALGKLYHYHARYLQQPGHDPAAPLEHCWYASGTRSGVLLGIGSHVIDLARFFMGEVTAVAGMQRTYNSVRRTLAGATECVTADEASLALVEFASGATGTLEALGVATGHRNQHTWEVTGSKGSLSWDLEDPNHLQVCLEESACAGLQGFTGVSVTDAEHPLRVIYLPSGHNAGWEYGHVHALHHFLDCVVNDRPVAPYGATFEDGYRVQAVMGAIAESARTGRTVSMPS